MGAPDPREADFAALLDKAEATYAAWHLKELRPERDRRLNELKRQKLTSGGRAIYAFHIYRELLERAVRQRIGFYSAVARESGNSQMLAKSRLDELRQLVMTSVGHAARTLKDHITMDNRAAGDIPETALPNHNQYTQLEAQILDVVNAELHVLEAEGKLARRTETQGGENQPHPSVGRLSTDDTAGVPAVSETNPPKLNRKGRKRGPARDYETAARVAEIVARVAPNGDWRSKLDDVCMEFDDAKVPTPKGWLLNHQCGSWYSSLDSSDGRGRAIKAITHHLKRAKEIRTETIS